MDDRELQASFAQHLGEVTLRLEKIQKALEDLESQVASLRNRLDKVQSQLSGERQLRKWFGLR